MIKEYILEKYCFKVHTAYIATVKRDLELPMYDAPNVVDTLKHSVYLKRARKDKIFSRSQIAHSIAPFGSWEKSIYYMY